MKTIVRSLLLTGVAAVGSLGLAAAPARAQAFGFSYASPGLSFGVGNGYYGYGAPVVAAPALAPPPVVLAPAPLIVAPPRPMIVAPRPYAYGGYYGRRPYYGYGRGYYRRW